MLDFDQLSGGSSEGGIIEPRKVFTTLVRTSRFRRPSDDQGEVLDAWFERRSRRDNTVKLNTGSGKTLVGLLVLQSSLNEGVAPAVYLTPDNYLAGQVRREAAELGIAATADEADPAFLAGQAILVVNVHKLINGKSVFGVGGDGRKIPIGAVVVDDAHACLGAVEDQFTIAGVAGQPVYDGLFAIFRGELERQSAAGVLELASHDPQSLMAVPFWAWKDRQPEVLKHLHAHRAADGAKFAWPLLKEVLPLCQCVFGGGRVEIAPRCLPIEEIASFARAERRIHMTATLADDGVLVTHFGADPEAAASPIKPKGAGDIGDRMILAPQEINPQTTTDDVKAFVVGLAGECSVVVIVPSFKRADVWRDVADKVLDKTNISDGVAELKRDGAPGLTVLVNKYDGVDLPGDACRVLVIDGLPEVYGLIERVEMGVTEGTDAHLLRHVQRIEQGMGRGVRSGEDHCVVLLLGAKLTQRVHLPAARAKFTPATLAQLDLGRDVTKQVRGKPISELRPLLEFCLKQDPKWWQEGRRRLARASGGSLGFVDPAVPSLREAFDAARDQRHDLACAAAQRAVNGARDPVVRGYLKQQLAEHTHHVDPLKAQEILLSAIGDNRRVAKPIQGIAYAKLAAPAGGQAAASVAFMRRRFVEPNDLVLFVQALLEDLAWDPDRTKRFEAAVRDAGLLLGFGSQRPEADIGKGPDNLWALGGLRFFIIECKSGAAGKVIAKEDCNQLTGSMAWFASQYDASCTGVPVMVHPVNRFDRYSSPLPGTRVLESQMLEVLKRQVRGFATAIAAANAMADAVEVARQLRQFKLTPDDLVTTGTKAFTVER